MTTSPRALAAPEPTVLTRLHIRNLAVLDEIELDPGPGFTVLTGETGAGKSMLVDALALALGERADSTAVRAGAERAEITAIFALTPGSPARRRGLPPGISTTPASVRCGGS